MMDAEKVYEKSLEVIEEVEKDSKETAVMEALAVMSNPTVLNNWDEFSDGEKKKIFEVNTQLLAKYFAYAGAIKEVKKYEENK